MIHPSRGRLGAFLLLTIASLLLLLPNLFVAGATPTTEYGGDIEYEATKAYEQHPASDECVAGADICPFQTCNGSKENSHGEGAYRLLAGGCSEVELGHYTIFIYVVITFFFLLVVEVALESMDHWAKNHPFFQYTLRTVYRELATLGVVEVIVFLLHYYWAGLPIKAEQKFALVHYMIFFAAIINALFSISVYALAKYNANRDWVTTELLAENMGAYVQVRREFEKIEDKLHGGNNLAEKMGDNLAGVTFHFDRRSLMHFIAVIWWRVRKPHTMRRYRKLLVQVRYHALREKFIGRNECSASFPLYKYLERAQRDVVEKVVHIGVSSWMMLVFFLLFLNYCMALVIVNGNLKLVGKGILYVFFSLCAIIVLFVLYLQRQMNYIFYRIMHSKMFWEGVGHNEISLAEAEHDIENSTSEVLQETRKKSSEIALQTSNEEKQIDLFWNSNPDLVIDIIRLLQFVCSLFLASFITVSKFIDNSSFVLVEGLLIIACVTSFVCIFLQASVINKYTLCTSVGQLVKKKFLNEVKVVNLIKSERKHRNETNRLKHDALGKSKLKKKQKDFKYNSGNSFNSVTETKHWEAIHELVRSTSNKLPEQTEGLSTIRSERRRRRMKTLSAGVGSMRKGLTDNNPPAVELKSIKDDSGVETISREQRRNRRKKAVSDGVFAMRSGLLLDEATKAAEKSLVIAKKKKPALESFLEDLPSHNPSSEMDPLQCLGPDYKNRQRSASICSDGSVSVVSVVPDPITFDPLDNTPEDKVLSSISQRLHLFLLSKRYNQFRLITTTVFFLMIGMRLNDLLVANNQLILNYNPNPCYLRRQFWTISLLCGLFFTEGLMLLVVFCCKKRWDKVLGGLLDCLLSLAGVIVLFAADHQRGKANLLCGCHPAMGQNSGLIGVLEPCLIFVILRILPIFKCLSPKNSSSPPPINLHSPLSPAGTEITESSNDNFKFHSTDAAASFNLWQEAIERNPDIANKHGLYSKQILLLMLGFKIEDLELMECDESSRSVGGNSLNLTAPAVTSALISPSNSLLNTTPTLMKHMRRVQIKLPPPLDRWKIVDAVITRNEIVFMKCVDIDEENARQDLIIRSKGGQGLMLDDAIVSRIVIGRIDLSEVDSVIVERHVASSKDLLTNTRSLEVIKEETLRPTRLPGLKGRNIEYWIRSGATNARGKDQTGEFGDANGWEDMEHDILRIKAEHTVTLIRFVDDWYHSMQQETEMVEKQVPTRALKWCQSIVRSYPKLQKDFVHFGENVGDELDDYLEYHYPHMKGWFSSRRLSHT